MPIVVDDPGVPEPRPRRPRPVPVVPDRQAPVRSGRGPGGLPSEGEGRLRIRVDGQPALHLAAALIALHVIGRIDEVGRLELTLESATPEAEAIRSMLAFGHRLEVELGSGAAATTVFDGRIDTIRTRHLASGPAQLIVGADDVLQGLRETRRTRTFIECSDADVIETIAAEHGLTVALDAPVGSPWPTLIQLDESDLAFVRERVQRLGATLAVEGQRLVVRRRVVPSTVAAPTLRYGVDLREVDLVADLAGQRTSVHVIGWSTDAAAVSHIAASEEVAGVGSGDRAGPGLLEATFGPRSETLLRPASRDATEVRSFAVGEMRRRAARFVTGWGLAEGASSLRVGAAVDLQGIAPAFEGRYLVVAVTHTVDAEHGHRTWFEVERPSLGEDA